jgi:putative ABC transport system permease protein
MRVVGVLEQRGQSLSGHDQDDMVVMPLTTARRRVMRDNALRQRPVHTVIVKVREGGTLSQAEESIRKLLRQRHRIGPGREDDFSVRNLAQVAEAEQESSRVMTFLLASIAAVSLLVGGIGIMNTLLVSVTERTREIGIRRAVGARRPDILLQFLLEAVTVAAIGGLFGIVLGVASAYVVALVTGWPIEVGAESVALAFGFAAAIGLIFGIYPANQAARLRPMDALRYE